MFLIALYSPKNDNKQPWNEKLAPQKLLYCNQSFSRFETHFDDRPKILTYRQIPPNIFYLRLSYEKKVSQAQNNWFIVKETLVYQRGVRRSAHPWYE